MVDEATEFWRAFEKETGETVEARGEGNWFRVPESGSAHEGLILNRQKLSIYVCSGATQTLDGRGHISRT